MHNLRLWVCPQKFNAEIVASKTSFLISFMSLQPALMGCFKIKTFTPAQKELSGGFSLPLLASHSAPSCADRGTSRGAAARQWHQRCQGLNEAAAEMCAVTALKGGPDKSLPTNDIISDAVFGRKRSSVPSGGRGLRRELRMWRRPLLKLLKCLLWKLNINSVQTEQSRYSVTDIIR